MKRIVVTAVIIASACGVFCGSELLAANTTSHEVQKGDTLWDLSGGYLNDPLLWPKIWKINPKITNPDLIKPGQVVKIPGHRKGQVRKVAVGGAMAPVATESSALARAGLASSSEPLPIIVVKKDLSQAGKQAGADQGGVLANYSGRGIGMLTNDIPNDGKVLQTEQGWHGAALGETILISAPGAQVGQQFGVYRDLGKADSLSYFSASPGHVLADIAIVEVVASDAFRQQAIIRQAFSEVQTDDVLGPVLVQPVLSERPVQAGAASVKGAVVACYLMRDFAAPDDIVYLNIGADHGLAPGNLLSVAGADQTEGRISGEIMVLRVAANTAAAVVTKRSAHEVRPGDVVGPPKL